MPEKPHNFWKELKRRKVVRVITVYAAAAFVIIELTNNITEPLRLPEWVPTLVIVLLAIGFLISIVMSWVYDITPEGVQKTKPSTKGGSEVKKPTSLGWKISTYISLLVIAAFVVLYIVSNIKKSSDIPRLEKTIAVLPFKNFSSDHNQEYMCNGLTDEIINHLYKIKSFKKVVSLNSVLTYKESKKRIPEIANELNVNYILEGTYKMIGDQVRVTAQLIEAQNDKHLWQNEYDKPFEEIITIQTDIALQIANELKTIISPEELEQINKKPTENLEAYNLYMKGRFLWEERSVEAQLRSVEYFEMSVAADPEYALAYAGLADAYYILGWYNWITRSEAYLKAKQYVLKALNIDNSLAEAHNTLGALYCWSDWNWEMAKKEFELAIGLSKSYASAHHYYSEYLDMIGDNIGAREQINLALDIDPNVLMFLKLSSFYYYHVGNYEKALLDCRRMQEVDRDYIYAHWWAFNIYVHQGEDLKAINELQQIMILDSTTKQYSNLVPEVFNKSGINGVYKMLINIQLEQSEPFASLDTDRSMILARWYAAIGEKKEALFWLEKALPDRPPGIPRLNNDPGFINLQSEPEFKTIIERLNIK